MYIFFPFIFSVYHHKVSLNIISTFMLFKYIHYILKSSKKIEIICHQVFVNDCLPIQNLAFLVDNQIEYDKSTF